MFRFKLYTTFLGLLLLTTAASAGVGSSGGGNAVVCRSGDGRILKATLLDLFEAEARGLKLLPPLGSITAEYRRALKNIRANILMDVEPTVEDEERFEGNIASFEQADEELPPVGDIGETVQIPANCKIEQLAIYDDTASDLPVRVSKEIWPHLNAMNQVALYTHEIIFRDYRNVFPLESSANLREIIGRLFSKDFPLFPVDTGMPSFAYECEGNVFPRELKFYMYTPSDRPDVRVFRIYQLEGRDLYIPIDFERDLNRVENFKRIDAGILKNDFIYADFVPETQGLLDIRHIPRDRTKPSMRYPVFSCHNLSKIN
jgi:hypothetical protein